MLLWAASSPPASTIIQALGPLLTPLPEWLVIAILVAGWHRGCALARTNHDTATIVLSALIGAGVLTDEGSSTLMQMMRQVVSRRRRDRR